jgi:hypothetical protein
MKYKYGGMTVNERLYLSGLMDEFDKALLRQDTNTLISILKEVELNNTNINAILKSQNLPKNSE